MSDRTDLRPQPKTFVFVSHTESIRHLASIGFNLFSLNNNHAYDYGWDGLAETARNMRRIQQEFPGAAYAGLGRTREEAAAPTIVDVRGVRVAMAAIGIAGSAFRPTGDREGVLNYHDESDFSLVLRLLREADADLRLLSLHFGTEGRIDLDPGQQAKFRRAVDEGGVDVVIGHHPHVVRPIEMYRGKLIIYSLGNYMMVGAASLDGRPAGRDIGLFARMYFDTVPGERRQQIQAMEVVALRGMSFKPRPVDPETGVDRVRRLNELSRANVGNNAVIFAPRRDGVGYACRSEAELGRSWGPRASRVCQGWVVPAAPAPLR